jgi:hypothetical protein
MPHYTVSPLPGFDANGDIRYPAEASWPIKARCIRCAGRKVIASGHTGQPCIPAPTQTCTQCNGRGYYFLPLGD